MLLQPNSAVIAASAPLFTPVEFPPTRPDMAKRHFHPRQRRCGAVSWVGNPLRGAAGVQQRGDRESLRWARLVHQDLVQRWAQARRGPLRALVFDQAAQMGRRSADTNARGLRCCCVLYGFLPHLHPHPLNPSCQPIRTPLLAAYQVR